MTVQPAGAVVRAGILEQPELLRRHRDLTRLPQLVGEGRGALAMGRIGAVGDAPGVVQVGEQLDHDRVGARLLREP